MLKLIRLIQPFLCIFNPSLAYGIFPKQWKSSFIKHIPKRGDPSNVRNYRPVYIISAILKLFDAIVTTKLYNKIYTLINNEHHGFSKGRSTETNLASFVDFFFDRLDINKQVDAFYSDFSRAFDCVNHDLELRKLYNLGIRGHLLDWRR